ncbi:MAG: DUF349 domain-containing protein [Balneola sp.]|nr:MAG: DUF349 domain-containing protein [Balneola sp.]
MEQENPEKENLKEDAVDPTAENEQISEEPVESSDTIAEEDSEDSTEEKQVEAETNTEEQVATRTEDSSEEVLENQSKEEATSEIESSEENESETPVEEGASEFYTDILKKAEEFISQDDWAFVSNELANLALHIEEGPDPNMDDAKEAVKKFTSLREEFETRKKAHYEELNKKKAENLEKKKALIKEFSDIINGEKWTATKEVGQIRNKWESIKVLPQGEVEALNERFDSLLEEFESHKVDRLVKKLQKEEENLTLKLVILEKMDALNAKIDDSADFDSLNKEFHDLLLQWRKVGRVPVEKNQHIWDHFNEAQDAFSQLRLKHDSEYRKAVEKSLEKKQKLIKEAEALIDEKDLAIAARKVNKLHNQWKKTGNLPQKEENELWDKFKHATDAFNEKKSDNIEVLRGQEQENLDKKLSLIEKAISIQDMESFEEGHQAMQQLMDQWKAIGPVPRKKSSKIWKQFKSAMDGFYDKRREYFKDVRKDQKENLTLKNELLAKLKELSESDDAALAVEEAKKIQVEFKKVGHVPLKFKNKIWKQYREVCDIIYERYRSSGADLGMERKLASQGIDPANRKEIIKYQKQLDPLLKEISRLEAELIQYQEATTYFKPSNKSNKLLDDLHLKINKTETEISEKKTQASQLRTKIGALKSSGTEE